MLVKALICSASFLIQINHCDFIFFSNFLEIMLLSFVRKSPRCLSPMREVVSPIAGRITTKNFKLIIILLLQELFKGWGGDWFGSESE